jgi:hypothetical protein
MMYRLLHNGYDQLSSWLADLFENEELQRVATKGMTIALDTAIRFFIVVLIFSIMISVGPSIETHFLGAMNSWRAENFRTDAKGNWEFDIYAVKPWYKGSCLYLKDRPIEAVAFPPAGSKPDVVRGTMQPDGKGRLYPDVSQNQNQAYAGHWTFITDQQIPVGSIISGTLQHQCHFLWISTTVFGPFQIKIENLPTP